MVKNQSDEGRARKPQKGNIRHRINEENNQSHQKSDYFSSKFCKHPIIAIGKN